MACLADTAVDDVLAAIQQPKDKALDFTAVYRALRYYGLPYLYRDDLIFESARAFVAERYPVMVLGNYGMLPKADKVDQKFTGAHWFLVVGANIEGVFVHDVNRPQGDESGQYLFVDGHLFTEMVGNPGWGNRPNQGLVIRREFPLLRPDPEAGQSIEAETADTLATLDETMTDVINELNQSRAKVARLTAENLAMKSKIGVLEEQLRVAVEELDRLE